MLVIQGGDPYLPSAVEQVKGLRRVFNERLPNGFEMTSEPLQALQAGAPYDSDALLAPQLKARYGTEPPDVVIALRRPAIDFLLRTRQSLWPSAPIVFCGIPEDEISELTPGPNISGVAMRFDVRGTLALARLLQPDARRIAVVAGSSTYDRTWANRVGKALATDARGFDVVWLGTGAIEETLGDVARLPPDTIVLYTSIFRDGRGNVFIPRDLIPQLAAASRAPIYSFFDTYFGQGIVGGSISNWQRQGEEAAELAVQMLAHPASETRGVVRPAPAAVTMVDWRAISRYALNEQALPPSTLVEFREPSFWARYRWQIAVAIALTALQAAIISALLVQRARARRAERLTVTQREALSQVARLSALGELTASISHEVNQPLGAIVTSADTADLLLRQQPPNVDGAIRLVGNIRRAGIRAGEVTHRVRSLVRRHQVNTVALDLNALITEMWPLVEGTITRAGVSSEQQLDSALPLVLADKGELQQVFLNLILNALDAMRASSGRRHLLVSTQRLNDDFALVGIDDSGHGLKVEEQRLFESFFTTKPDGMGLGLPIARSIVEAHGGTITAVDNAQGGASFRFTLPIARTEIGSAGGLQEHGL
ncbi:sensor histidine kinase [Variovorax rhizosphaerae]|uniref:histidine kinase n=1 Tax=Variovorax rhizosphaerae TaxID=1836200 RepID=A0ABU8WE88_9BURK